MILAYDELDRHKLLEAHIPLEVEHDVVGIKSLIPKYAPDQNEADPPKGWRARDYARISVPRVVCVEGLIGSGGCWVSEIAVPIPRFARLRSCFYLGGEYAEQAC